MSGSARDRVQRQKAARLKARPYRPEKHPEGRVVLLKGRYGVIVTADHTEDDYEVEWLDTHELEWISGEDIKVWAASG